MAQALASVGLSDDQKATIRSIMKDARKQNEGLDPETRRANYRAAYEKALAVMTPDQLVRFKAKLAELRKEHESGAQSSS
jgi:TRAP-type C4-dicarboxylate transport system substrate-binding protein